MKAVEASGKTREQAMESALKELGVELYEVDKIEVLDEGNKGLFGFGARPVRVRLTVEHLEDDRGARSRGGRGQRPERGGQQQRGPQPDSRDGQQQRSGAQQRDGRGERGGERNRPERPGAQQGQQRQQQQQKPAGQQGQQKQQQKPQQQRSGGPQGQRGQGQGQQQRGPRPERPQGQQQQPRQQQPRPAPKPAVADDAAEGDRPRHVNVHEEALDALRRAEQFEQFDAATPVAPEEIEDTDALEAAEAGGEERPDEAFEPITDEQGQEAAVILRELIVKMGIEAEVTFVRSDDGAAKLDVRSQDSAMLIGRKGRTLGAMQYLVNRMIAQGDAAENTERFMIDVEGYVDRRRETLEDLARHFAGRVKESGRPARLKPLSPQERRIIHMTLRNDPEVRTASLGESLYRTVVISPINARPGRPRGQGQSGGGGRGRGNRGGRGRGGGGRRPGGPPRQQGGDLDPGQLSD